MITQAGIPPYLPVSHSNQPTYHRPQPEKDEGQHSANTANTFRTREFDFSNMTLEEQANAAQALYNQGLLSLGDMAVLTGRYELIKHDGQLGDTSLSDAKNEKFNVIEQLKENLSFMQKQGSLTPDAIDNYKSIINKLETYQHGINLNV